jgi:hypothetical protein
MFAAYKVGVHLTLVNGVGAVLARIITHMGAFDRSVHGANTRLGELHTQMQKIKSLGVIGAGMATLGVGGLMLFKGPLHEATEWERVMARLQQKGLGDGQIADAKKFLRANDIYGVSLLERAQIFDEAQGSFRESGMSGSAALDAAKTMTPVLAAYKLAMATLNDHSRGAAEGSFSSLNKIVELMGGLGDTKLAGEIVGGVFKAVQSSGKMVSERDLRQFITMGGSAVSGLSLRTIFGGLEPQIGEFGGSAVGTGLNTAYRLLTGAQSKPSRLFVREAIKVGLWNQDNLVFNSQGGIKAYNGNPLKPEMQNLLRSDTIGFAKALMTLYAQQGIASQQDREHENEILLGRTGAKIYNKIMLQLSTIESSLNSYDHSETPDQVNSVQKNSIIQKSIELQKRWNDATLNFGLVAMPIAIKVTDGITWALKSFTDYARENPKMVRAMTLGFIGLSAAMALGGTMLLLSAAFKGLSLGFPLLGTVIGALATPIGIAVLAIGTLAAALYAFRPETKKEIDAAKTDGGARLTPGARARADALGWDSENTLTTKALDWKNTKKWYWYQFGRQELGEPAPAIAAGQQRPVVIAPASAPRPAQTGAPYAAGGKKSVQIVVNNILDGRVVSQSITDRMVNEMLRPAAGLNSYDGSMGFMSPSQAR